MESKSLPRAIPVKIFEGTEKEKVVNVRKLPIGKSAQLALAFKSAPAKIAEILQNPELKELLKQYNDDTPVTEILPHIVNYLPDILAGATDVVIDIISIGAELPREEIAEVGIDEALSLLSAILTVNDLERIKAEGKFILGRLGMTKPNTLSR